MSEEECLAFLAECEALRVMFTTSGWKVLAASLERDIDSMNMLTRAESWDQVNQLKGGAAALANLQNLPAMTDVVTENLLEQLEDIRNPVEGDE